MSTIDQTTRKEDGGNVLTGFLRNTLQTGLGVAEKMHQSAVEVPLNMLKSVGVPEEKSSELKDKHRSLLRGMYGSIDSIATQCVDLGEKQASILTTGIRDLVDSNKAAQEETTAEEVSAEEKSAENKSAAVAKS